MVKLKKSRRAPKLRPKNEDSFNDEENDEFEEAPLRKWYENLPKDPEDFKPLSDAEVNQLREEARVVLENDTLHHRNKNSGGSKGSQNDWLQTMVTKGTFKDRLAASVVLVQNSPLHGLGTVRSLVNQVKTGKKNCTKAMEVLTDLFTSDLLIPNKKLRLFEKRPLSLLEKLSDGSLIKRKYFLSHWYFEDQLKNEYRNFIQAIRDIGKDTVNSNREKSIIAMQKLLTAHPEEEVLLLSSLVNKIGDPTAAVASRAVLHLKMVLKEHPNMKTVVLNEIEKLVFRSNVSQRAQYYGICFLSQYLLRKTEEELANRLIHLYFAFFKACIKKGEVDSRMMSALLVGVNRAFPFAKRDTVELKEHIDTMYRIVHIAQFGVSLHALYLLFQVADYDATISDRFYSVLYQQILHPGLSGSSHHAMFISLVFRAMSKDIQFNRTKVFIKRLLQVCHYVPASLACGILIMISHMLKKFPNLKSLSLIPTEFKEESENEESDGEHYVDVPLEEINEENQNESNSNELPIVGNNIELSEIKSEEKKPIISSWFHLTNVKDRPRGSKDKPLNIHARNPLFLAGELNVYTELVSLSSHYHPSVSVFANHLLEGKEIEYPGDPLRDFTQTKFLERWVFKNPKKLNKNSETKLSRKTSHAVSGVKNLPVNSEEYLNTAESDIPPEELFMYRFLKKQQMEGKGIKREKDDDDDSDISSVASEEFDGIIDQLMGGKEEIDFAEGIKPSSTAEKKKKKKGESDDDSASSEDEMDDEADDDSQDSNIDDDSIPGSDSDLSENEEEADDVEGDEDINYDDIKEEFSDLDEIDDDEAAISFDDDSEDDFSFTMSDVEKDELEHKQKKNSKIAISKGKKLKKGIDSSVFAPAEEFAQILEDTGDQIAKYGNLANISNRDNAGVKQLKWEMSRNQWIRGHRDKRKRPGGFPKKGNKKFKKR